MKRALIVEDDIGHQYIFETLVKKYDCVSDVTPDGIEALAYVKTNNYDLIILDILLRSAHGPAILEYLQNHSPDVLSRTVVVSAWRGHDLENITRRYGVPAIRKPFDIDTVKKNISDILNKKKLIIDVVDVKLGLVL